MNVEEKKAINNLKEIIELVEEELKNNNKNTNAVLDIIDLKSLDTVLNLVNKQLSEIKEKDKQINLMAKKLNQAYFEEDKFCVWFEKMMGVQKKMDYGYVVDLIKQYFEKQAKRKENK